MSDDGDMPLAAVLRHAYEALLVARRDVDRALASVKAALDKHQKP